MADRIKDRRVAYSGRVGDAPDLRLTRSHRVPALPVCRVTPDNEAGDRELTEHEWLVTNGIGGYSSGTVAGVVTRRYHGILVAALSNPLGRMVMLNELRETVRAAKVAL